MPVFISYSHNDAHFVDKLAAHLVKGNASVWVDTWELNVGDSILNKVQDAIEGSDALLIVLSKASVQSEWCKKEISAGLMRELSEKKVVVLPVLLEDCEIPIFLREKMYADFRTDFDWGLQKTLDAIAKVTNTTQGRLSEKDNFTDWAIDWGYTENLFTLNFTIINVSQALPITLLVEVEALCNPVATKRYEQYSEVGLEWLGRNLITEFIYDLGSQEDLRIILDNQFPKIIERGLSDSKTGVEMHFTIKCRKLGEDNGKDQLVNLSEYLTMIRDYMRHISRKPTKEEYERLVKILSTPIK
jgi:hypothetical protein